MFRIKTIHCLPLSCRVVENACNHIILAEILNCTFREIIYFPYFRIYLYLISYILSFFQLTLPTFCNSSVSRSARCPPNPATSSALSKWLATRIWICPSTRMPIVSPTPFRRHAESAAFCTCLSRSAESSAEDTANEMLVTVWCGLIFLLDNIKSLDYFFFKFFSFCILLFSLFSLQWTAH